MTGERYFIVEDSEMLNITRNTAVSGFQFDAEQLNEIKIRSRQGNKIFQVIITLAFYNLFNSKKETA